MDKPPPDPADPAEDLARRYVQELDYPTGDRMAELGIPTGQIGSRTPGQGHACFMPHKVRGVGNDPAGGLMLDPGFLCQVAGVRDGPRLSLTAQPD